MKLSEFLIEERWGRHANARTPDNIPCSMHNPEAVRFCVLGAYCHLNGLVKGVAITTDPAEYPEKSIKELTLLSKLISANYTGFTGGSIFQTITNFNDQSCTTYPDVKRILTKWEEILESEEIS